jgi:hypothetical protein
MLTPTRQAEIIREVANSGEWQGSISGRKIHVVRFIPEQSKNYRIAWYCRLKRTWLEGEAPTVKDALELALEANFRNAIIEVNPQKPGKRGPAVITQPSLAGEKLKPPKVKRKL